MEGIGWRPRAEPRTHTHKLATYHARMVSPLKPSTARGPSICCLDIYSWNWVGMHFVTLLVFNCMPIPWELRLDVRKSIVGTATNVTCIMSRTKTRPFYTLTWKCAIWEGTRRTVCWLIGADRTISYSPMIGDTGFLSWQHQCWGYEILSLEADVKITSIPFWDWRYFFVWLAVPRKPSSQPIWLKV